MLKTPLYNTHISLNAKIAPFGGWLMPIQYQGILAEHAHTRKRVSVFDICHMGEFMLEADPSLSGFDRIVTQNIISMPEGSCRYGFMLNEQAGILDDLVVYRINKTSWMLVVNAATTPGDYAHLKKNLTGKYNLKDISDKTGKLDVQGPESLDVLKSIFGDGLSKLNYYNSCEFTFQNQRCMVSRTGYTGELGYEIYISTDYVVKLWEVLLKDSRVKPAGLGSRDTLRLEMGYPLYGQDLDINHTPLAAGLVKFVDLSKDFIGKDALLKEQASGPKERLICFQADSRRAPRHGFAIFANNQRVGTVTSGSFSPSLSVGIGIGYVCGNYDVGSRLIVKDAGTEIPVVVIKRPFISKTSLLGTATIF
ncbi:MAG: glycine cleavage system aminomethyltransferase GcvT [Candidatus Omnitrophica bacterium]|nr:glycine cleavage system aminomethyltransferase GcvT [Candidatus Omnitrophota bacterium]